MKKNLSLCMALSLMLSISGQTHAVTFKERAERIRQKAIALAKKGGKYAKKFWDKINFMDRATKERKAAEEALKKCANKPCGAELEERRVAFAQVPIADQIRYSDPYNMARRIEADKILYRYDMADKSLKACEVRHCPNERKRIKQAGIKELLSGMGLAVLISAATMAAGAGVVEGAVTYDERQEKERRKVLELEKIGKEAKKKELEEWTRIEELEKTEKKWGQSPLYEAPGQ